MAKTIIKMPQTLLDQIKQDLARPHSYAYERVGFCYGRSVKLKNSDWLVVICDYRSVEDKNYIRTNEVGARINSKAITEAFQYAFREKKSLFHIHNHGGTGVPDFSMDDMNSCPDIIKSMLEFVEEQPHGMIVLSNNSLNAMGLCPGEVDLSYSKQLSVVGKLLTTAFPESSRTRTFSERYSRQSFLGKEAERKFSQLKIGVVGLSGGGSHIVQQMAHIGFLRYVLSDPDIIDEESNLNRIVGATYEDAKRKRSKFDVFERLIKGLHPAAEVEGGKMKWEELTDDLKSCNIIFGCLDTILGRRDLENFCRRYLIPYIDIGMGIETEHRPYAMFGQVQVSTPGCSCLKCNKFITEENLKREANNYGVKEKRPQVIWPNGILASTAVGIAVDMITNWSDLGTDPDYLSYEGNTHQLGDHPMKEYRKKVCEHYPISAAGPLSLGLFMNLK